MSAAEPAPLFAALGDPTRLALLARLCDEGPQSASRLAREATVTRQAVAKHLRVLADAGLIRGERRGREQVWALDGDRLGEARRYLDRVSARWDAALERLRALVEE